MILIEIYILKIAYIDRIFQILQKSIKCEQMFQNRTFVRYNKK